MYHAHFGLTDPPFKITPDPRLFYTGGERGLVLDALIYAIRNGEGMIKVVGEVGSGKTMLCRMLPDKLADSVDILYLANPRLTPDTILQALALEMQLPIAHQQPPPNHLQVMQALHEALLARHGANRQVVLLIEEAQSMPLDTLEEVRLLSNLETTRHKLLQIVLFGQPELDANLATPRIRQLKERITHSFQLAPLSKRDLGGYLDFRLRAVGYRGPPVFEPAAMQAIARYSQGFLRRTNILADKALLAAFTENTHRVTARHIRRAAEDSGFNPATTTAPLWLLGLFLIAGGLGLGLLYGLPATSPSFKTDLTPSPALDHVKAVPVPLSPPAPVAVPTTLQTRLAATQTWLASADARHHSIQLMQSERDNLAVLAALLDQPQLRPLLPFLYVYRHGPGWGLLYGDFASRSDAQAALLALPESLRRHQPFIRNLASLREKLGYVSPE